MEKMSKIDIGISLAHLSIAAQNQNQTVDFVKEPNMSKPGYEYIVTCKLV